MFFFVPFPLFSSVVLPLIIQLIDCHSQGKAGGLHLVFVRQGGVCRRSHATCMFPQKGNKRDGKAGGEDVYSATWTGRLLVEVC